MAPRRVILVGAAVLTASGCGKRQQAWTYPAPSAATRPAVIPAADALTLATPGDSATAVAVSTDGSVVRALRDYLGPRAPRWDIVGSREVGRYLLLWVAFPDIADGGIDLVYDTVGKRVEWQFKGGIRG